MAQSIPINPSYGKPKEPWGPGGKDRGPIVSPPDIGEIGGVAGGMKAKFACRRKAGNTIMKVGKK